MAGKKISLCMIVKDEKEYLEGALESVSSLVDEIIVVDTGSQDGSQDIARALGTQVVTCPWRGDFSKARNASLAEASGDFILILDADERIAERNQAKIRAAVDEGSTVTFQFPQWIYMFDSAVVDWKKRIHKFLRTDQR